VDFDPHGHALATGVWRASSDRSEAWATPTTTPWRESVIGLFETGVIRPRGPWRNIDTVEFAVLEWVDWLNNRRLLEAVDYVPPVEYETGDYQAQNSPAAVAGLDQPSLREPRAVQYGFAASPWYGSSVIGLMGRTARYERRL
jgi:hypothetical protein